MTYKIYELKLKPTSSWITDLTADTIFGHLCWQIKYHFWDDILEEFLKEMVDKPIFTISDVLPADRLPRPLTEYDWNLWKRTKITKEYNQQITYIPENELKKFSNYDSDKIKNIINSKDFENEDNKKWTYFSEKIENKNIVNRLAWTTLENWIYSQWVNEFNENKNELRILIKSISNKNLRDYYLKIWENKEIKIDFFELFKNIFENWYWKKKSSWKWAFIIEQNDFDDITELFSNTWNNILLLSSFIPSKDDPTDWNYKLFTKFPKLWEEFSLEWQNFYKKPLVMIQPGSTFKKTNNNWYVGKMIKDVNLWKFYRKDVKKDPETSSGWQKEINFYHYAYGFIIEF